MAEVEAKYVVKNLDSVERELIKLGAKLLSIEREDDTYFQHPCRDFSLSDEALRLRVINGERVELTYKGPRSGRGVKSRLEISVDVKDKPELIRDLLEKLGFKSVATVSKVRKVYGIPGVEVRVCLDEVEELGSFVEIEAHGEPEGLSSVVTSIAEQLGLKGSLVPKTYLELILEKRGSSGT